MNTGVRLRMPWRREEEFRCLIGFLLGFVEKVISGKMDRNGERVVPPPSEIKLPAENIKHWVLGYDSLCSGFFKKILKSPGSAFAKIPGPLIYVH